MIMEKYITQNGIKYELRGEQYYPMLEVSEEKEHQIGKYGLLHRDYIKQIHNNDDTTEAADKICPPPVVRVFITDLILRHSAEVVETYSQSAENACVYKEFCNTKGI